MERLADGWALRLSPRAGYWWNDSGLRRLNVWLAVLQMGSIVVGYDGSK